MVFLVLASFKFGVKNLFIESIKVVKLDKIWRVYINSREASKLENVNS